MIGKPYDEGVSTSVSPASVAVPRPIRIFMLTATSGPDAGKSSIDVSRGGRILLGQSPACTVRLEDHTVSRRHAAFDVVDGALCLTDLGSTNGTFVNGVRAREVSLAGGETIQVGSDVFRLERGGESVEAAETQTSFGRFVGASPESAAFTRPSGASLRRTSPSSSKGRPARGKRSSRRRFTSRGCALRGRSSSSTVRPWPPA